MSSDITKCSGVVNGVQSCPRLSRCERYMSPANWRQSYFVSAPLKDDGSCDYFVESAPVVLRRRR